MSDRISGADLQPGQVFRNHGGRLYEVVSFDPQDDMGGRFGTFKQSNGSLARFVVFHDSSYELRDALPARPLVVKVNRKSLTAALAELDLSLDGLSFQKTADAILKKL